MGTNWCITDLGEALEQTAIREAKEETGLDISNLRLLGTTSGEDCYIEFPNEDKAYFISICFFTNTFTGDLVVDNIETRELCFFSYNELPTNIPKTHRAMIDKYFTKIPNY